MQVEPFFTYQRWGPSKIFHDQSECGTGLRIVKSDKAITGDISDKTLCTRCAEIGEAMLNPEKMAEKRRATKPVA
jgi:hypothetical protein